MNRLTPLLAVATIACFASSNGLAQESSKPTLTIARFDGTLKSSSTGDTGADLADAIATRVEESGCCRVMLRSFLPQAAPGKSLSLDTIREAAVNGRVQYVIAGRASTTRTVGRSAAPSIATMLGRMGPGSSPYAAGGLRGPVSPRFPYPIAARPFPVTVFALEMRIIDAASGQVLRTVNISRPIGANVLAVVADSSEVSDALIHAIASLERERPRSIPEGVRRD
jgi:hypothetical protein